MGIIADLRTQIEAVSSLAQAHIKDATGPDHMEGLDLCYNRLQDLIADAQEAIDEVQEAIDLAENWSDELTDAMGEILYGDAA